MSEIYIRTDKETNIVTFVHRRPFDPTNGLNTTRDELLKTGFFITEYPEPVIKMGKRAIPYYDHEAKKVYYEYQTIPFEDSVRLDMIEQIANSLILNIKKLIGVKSEGDDGMIMDGFAKYLAYQIYLGNLERDIVVNTYPEIKDDIDKFLKDYETIPVIKED